MTTLSHPLSLEHGRRLFRRLRDAAFWRADSVQGLLSLTDQAIVSGTSFLTSVIVARCGSREDLGAFFLAWNVVLLVQAIQSDLVSAPYVVFCRRHRGNDVASYTGSALVHQLAIAAGAALVIAVMLSCLSRGGGSDLQGFREAGLAFLAAMPFLLVRHFIRSLGYAHLRVGTTTFVDGLVAGFQLSGLLALSAFGALSVSNAYLVLGAACAVPTGVWLVSRVEPLHFDRRLVGEHWRQNWSFGRWALASQLTGRATGYALPWTLALVHGEASTGLLAACVTLVNIIGTFITGVSNYLTPRAAAAYAAGGVSQLYGVLRRVACLYLGVVGAFVVVLMVWGGQASAVVYGPQYAGGEAVIRLLALALLANSLSITVGNGLWAINRPEANFAADFCTLVSGLVVLAFTVAAWGAVGAACALLAGNVVGMLVRWQTLRTATAGLRPEGAVP